MPRRRSQPWQQRTRWLRLRPQTRRRPRRSPEPRRRAATRRQRIRRRGRSACWLASTATSRAAAAAAAAAGSVGPSSATSAAAFAASAGPIGRLGQRRNLGRTGEVVRIRLRHQQRPAEADEERGQNDRRVPAAEQTHRVRRVRRRLRELIAVPGVDVGEGLHPPVHAEDRSHPLGADRAHPVPVELEVEERREQRESSRVGDLDEPPDEPALLPGTTCSPPSITRKVFASVAMKMATAGSTAPIMTMSSNVMRCLARRIVSLPS